MIYNNPPKKEIIKLIANYTNENEQDIEVIFDCIKATNTIIWNEKTINWFYKMDFIPGNWKYLFNIVIQSIFSK